MGPTTGAINNRGQIVGWSAAGRGGSICNYFIHAVLWTWQPAT